MDFFLPHSLQVTNGFEDKKNERRFKKRWLKLTKALPLSL